MQPKGIVIHCSDSPNDRGDTAETVHGWHLANGWDGIGYHYVILEDGTVENGRPDYWQGAHAPGHNDKIGIMLFGRGEDDFTEEQYLSLEGLVLEKVSQYGFKDEDIIGHNEVSSKKCPGFNVREWVSDIL